MEHNNIYHINNDTDREALESAEKFDKQTSELATRLLLQLRRNIEEETYQVASNTGASEPIVRIRAYQQIVESLRQILEYEAVRTIMLGGNKSNIARALQVTSGAINRALPDLEQITDAMQKTHYTGRDTKVNIRGNELKIISNKKAEDINNDGLPYLSFDMQEHEEQ